MKKIKARKGSASARTNVSGKESAGSSRSLPRKFKSKVPDEAFMSREEVAELFHVTSSTVTRWARHGLIPVLRTIGGHNRYLRAAIRPLTDTRGRIDELVRLD